MSASPHYNEAAPWVGGRLLVLRLIVWMLTVPAYLFAWLAVAPAGLSWWLLRGRAAVHDERTAS